MDLTEHEGSSYLAEGEFIVRVKDFEEVESNNSIGVKVWFHNALGRKAAIAFWIRDKRTGEASKAIWNFANFCVAAGVPEEVRRAFNENSFMKWCRQHLLNKEVGIETKKNEDGYTEVVTIYPANKETDTPGEGSVKHIPGAGQKPEEEPTEFPTQKDMQDVPF